MKIKRMRCKKRIKQSWTEYLVYPVTCECGKRYRFSFRICAPGKGLVLDVPTLVEEEE